MWRINGGAVPPENRVPIYESTHASLDCPQSDWRVHQRATTAGLTYISLTHRHTGRHRETHTHTHTIASVSATFLCGVEKALKQHLDQQRTLKIPSETQKFVQVCQLFRAERAISPI